MRLCVAPVTLLTLLLSTLGTAIPRGSAGRSASSRGRRPDTKWATNAGPTAPVPIDQLRREPICIVGAGPGGLQTSFFLQQLGIPYAVLDKGTRGVGDFFRDYPRQRTLDSVNKVYTGSRVVDGEFHLRHDWNSLLGHWDDDPGLLPGEPVGVRQLNVTPGSGFAQFSKQYYPKADALVEYLEDWAVRNQLEVQLGRRVVAVHRFRNGTFRLTHDAVAGRKRPSRRFELCTSVVWATGQGALKRLPRTVRGAELVTYYDEMDSRPETYANKEVLVYGAGNAALEVAQALEDHAAHVHLAMRGDLRFAHQTHYAGHARARNVGILDRYLLKSLDVILPVSADAAKLVYYKHNASDDRVRIMGDPALRARRKQQRSSQPPPPGMGKDLQDLFELEEDILHDEVSPFRRGYHHVILCLGFHTDPQPFMDSAKELESLVAERCSKVSVSRAAACRATVSTEIAPVHPAFHDGRRMPIVASNFESINMRDFFVAGHLMHFRDYKRSSGGFIHGFRYLCRTLALLMRERYLGVPYPTFTVSSQAMPQRDDDEAVFGGRDFGYSLPVAGERLIKYVMNRLSNVSSLYLMKGQLADVIILDADEDGTPVESDRNWVSSEPSSIRVLRDMPLDMATSKNPQATSPQRLQQSGLFLTLSLEYGPWFAGPGTVMQMGETESVKSRLEKQGWHPEDDPDLHLGQPEFRPSHRSVRLPTQATMNRGLHPVPDALKTRRLPGEVDRAETARSFWSPWAQTPLGSSVETDDRRENGSDEVGTSHGEQAVDDDGLKYNPRYSGEGGRHREQGLHPVFRMYRRPPEAERTRVIKRTEPETSRLPPLPEVSPDVSPAELMHEFRLREDALDDWSLPQSHVRHLRAYFAQHVFRAWRKGGEEVDGRVEDL